MLCAEGIKMVEPSYPGGKSRQDLVQERRRASQADASHWNALQHQQRHENKMKRLSLGQTAFGAKPPGGSGGAAQPARPATARTVRIAAAVPPASSEKITAAPEPPHRDHPPQGVKRIEGKSGAQCETYYRDYSSKKTFDAKAAHSPGKFSCGPVNEQQNTQFIHVVKDTYRRPLSARTPHKYDVTPKVCATEEQWKATGINQPKFLPVPMQAKLRRPEITALDSFEIPIYSCFARDKKFKPRVDDAMKVLKKRREEQHAEKMEKLKMRMTNQKITVEQYRLEGEHQADLKASGLVGAQDFVSPRLEAVSPENVEAPFDPFKVMQEKKKRPEQPPIAGGNVAAALAISSAKATASHQYAQRSPQQHSHSQQQDAGRSPHSPQTTSISPPDSRRHSPSRAGEEDSNQHHSATKAPRPPMHSNSGSHKVRPHTAGANRNLQHAVEPRQVQDVTDAEQLETISRPVSAKTTAAAVTTSAGCASARPHSAKPVSSPRMAMELGGLDNLRAVSRGGNSVEVASTDIAYSTLTGGRAAATKAGELQGIIAGNPGGDGGTETPNVSMMSLLATLLKGDQARRQKAPRSNTSVATEPSVFKQQRPASGKKKVTVLESQAEAMETDGAEKLPRPASRASTKTPNEEPNSADIVNDDGPPPSLGQAAGDTEISGWFG